MASTYFKTLEIDKSNNLLIKIEANLLVFNTDIIIQASDDNNQTVSLSKLKMIYNLYSIIYFWLNNIKIL